MKVPNKFPKLIRVLPGNRLDLDGREFPWYIVEQGVSVNIGDRRNLTSVTVTIPCDRIEIDDQLSRIVEIEDGWSLGAVARMKTPTEEKERNEGQEILDKADKASGLRATE